MTDLTLLQNLLETPGVSGREHFVRKVIRRVVERSAFFDEIKEDAMGNLICLREGHGSNRRRILMAAHMDQAGFLVSHISSEGVLRLHPVGTFDVRALASQPVSVVARSGDMLSGTLQVSALPIHTTTPKELSKQLSLLDFFVDLGLPAATVKSAVCLGDMVVFRSPMESVGNEIVAAGLDDRIGCWALIEALSSVQNEKDDLICAFTVQEELGSRGAGPVAHTVKPDIAIVCETVVSCQVPGIPDGQHVTALGHGIALQVADSSLISDVSLVEIAEQAASAAGVLVQRSLMLGGGQDGAVIQRSGAGVRTIALGCPLKFMHASREHANLSDVLSYPILISTLIDAV